MWSQVVILMTYVILHLMRQGMHLYLMREIIVLHFRIHLVFTKDI